MLRFIAGVRHTVVMVAITTFVLSAWREWVGDMLDSPRQMQDRVERAIKLNFIGQRELRSYRAKQANTMG